MTESTEKPKLLIVDTDFAVVRRLADFLEERGFSCRIHKDTDGLRETLSDWKPHFILYDMMMPKLNGFQFLDLTNKKNLAVPRECVVLMSSRHRHPENVRRCVLAGAHAFVLKPFKFEDILSRLAFHSQKKTTIAEVAQKENGPGEYFLYLTEILFRKTVVLEAGENLYFDILKMLALATHSVRCSLIQCDVNTNKGVVLHSSDDKNFRGFCIDLSKYPEVDTVLNSEKLVAIDNVSANTVMRHIQKQVQAISFNSMIVCPIWVNGKVFGVISARRAQNAPKLTDAEIRFTQIAAYALGLRLESATGKDLLSAA